MKITIVSPVFNEEEGILTFINELNRIAGELKRRSLQFNLLLVNDGSRDSSLDVISNARPDQLGISVLNLSRNFGHQAAVWAGLENAKKDHFVIVMDSDLQDPPTSISQIISAFKSGSDVVFMKRRSRRDGFWKRNFADIYYRIQAEIVGNSKFKNIGDFYGLSPRARQALLQHTESVKYIRGLVSQLGFNQEFLEYDRDQRFAGRTNYSIGQMFSLAIAGITGFSIKPLLWVVYFALGGTFLATTGVFYVFFLKLKSTVVLQPGWAFLSISILTMSALELIGIALIALYLARIVQEIKQRPIYFATNNLEEAEPK